MLPQGEWIMEQFWMKQLDGDWDRQKWPLTYTTEKEKAIEETILIALSTNQSWELYNEQYRAGLWPLSTILIGAATRPKKLYPIEGEDSRIYSDASEEKTLVCIDCARRERNFLFNQFRNKKVENKKAA